MDTVEGCCFQFVDDMGKSASPFLWGLSTKIDIYKALSFYIPGSTIFFTSLSSPDAEIIPVSRRVIHVVLYFWVMEQLSFPVGILSQGTGKVAGAFNPFIDAALPRRFGKAIQLALRLMTALFVWHWRPDYIGEGFGKVKGLRQRGVDKPEQVLSQCRGRPLSAVIQSNGAQFVYWKLKFSGTCSLAIRPVTETV
jgi:hypothetical protein